MNGPSTAQRLLILAIASLALVFAITAPAHAQSDLARAYRIIASKQLVDLTHSFSPTTPGWYASCTSQRIFPGRRP